MELGKIPSEFSKAYGDGKTETVFLCDEELVPDSVPDHALFVSTKGATLNSYIQLFLLYDDVFEKKT